MKALREARTKLSLIDAVQNAIVAISDDAAIPGLGLIGWGVWLAGKLWRQRQDGIKEQRVDAARRQQFAELVWEDVELLAMAATVIFTERYLQQVKQLTVESSVELAVRISQRIALSIECGTPSDDMSSIPELDLLARPLWNAADRDKLRVIFGPENELYERAISLLLHATIFFPKKEGFLGLRHRRLSTVDHSLKDWTVEGVLQRGGWWWWDESKSCSFVFYRDRGLSNPISEENDYRLGLESENLKPKADKYGYRFHAPTALKLIPDDRALPKWSAQFASLEESQAAASTNENVP